MAAQARIRDLVEDIRYLWEDRNSRVEEVLEQDRSPTQAERLRLRRDLMVLDEAFADKVHELQALLREGDEGEATG